MQWFKAWFLRWLGITGIRADIEILIRAERDFDQYKLEADATISQLIAELNELRNRIPASIAQQTKPTTRVFRNWGEFKTAVEGTPQRIPIERKS